MSIKSRAGSLPVKKMPPAELIEENGVVGVRFRFENKSVAVTFATQGEAAGHVKITSGENILIDDDLTRQITPQAGLSGG